MFNAHNITVSFGGETLFDEISFRLGRGDHIGLIGKNGAGKSTLLKLMTLENQPTSGSFALEKNCKIGYLPQDLDFDNGRTVLEEAYLAFEEIKKVESRQEEIHKIMEQTQDYESQSYMELLDELNELNNRFEMIGGYHYQSQTEKILLGLGFNMDDLNASTDMIVFAEEAGANVRSVSLIHATRILVIVVILPVILSSTWEVNLTNPPGMPLQEFELFQLMLLFISSVLGWWMAKKLGLFGASILGPLILAAIFSLSGFLNNRPPAEIIWAAQYFIAIGSGLAFLVAQLLDVKIFDTLRKKEWFIAPLTSSMIGSTVDTFLFFIFQRKHRCYDRRPQNHKKYAQQVMCYDKS